MSQAIMSDLKRRMDAAIDAYKKDLSGLRVGRANPNLLDPVMVDAYGAMMPLNQVASVTVADARLLSVNVWDKGLIKNVEKAIREAGLGLNPLVDGASMRIPLPELTEERRKELSKVAAKYAETSKVAIRNVRRDGMEAVKTEQKNKTMAEDEAHRVSEAIQKLTDETIGHVDHLLAEKDKDIRQV